MLSSAVKNIIDVLETNVYTRKCSSLVFFFFFFFSTRSLKVLLDALLMMYWGVKVVPKLIAMFCSLTRTFGTCTLKERENKI